MKPRSGLLRSREFIMKDMYTFDSDLNSAEYTYAVINQAYERIFKRIGIPYTKFNADSGIMGGSVSHEYHYVSNIGEDTILLCDNCKYKDKLVEREDYCPNCKGSLQQLNSVEVISSKHIKYHFIHCAKVQNTENLLLITPHKKCQSENIFE